MAQLQKKYFPKDQLVARTTTSDLNSGYEAILDEGDKDQFSSLLYNKNSFAELQSFQNALGAPALSNFFKVSMDLAPESTTPIRNFPGDSNNVTITKPEEEVVANGLNQWLTSAGVLGPNDPKIRYELLANEAMLPGTSMSVAQEQGSRQGIRERFATQRQYTDIAISFYVSSDYKILRLFQEWINFMNPLYVTQQGIKSPHAFPGGYPNNDEGYAYHRFRYPTEYKKNISVTKFERNLGTGKDKGGRHNLSAVESRRGVEYTPDALSYNFINCFPTSIQDIPLNYQAGQVLQCQVEFSYDRYYIVNSNGLPQKDTPTQGGEISSGSDQRGVPSTQSGLSPSGIA
tara:strand:+ start:4 stop:1038 length:1035 start_codon:yes stop_codon:yes gene_type:complete